MPAGTSARALPVGKRLKATTLAVALLSLVGSGLVAGATTSAQGATDEPATLDQLVPGMRQRVEAVRGLDGLAEVPIRTVLPEEAARENLEAIRPDDLANLRDDEVLLQRVGFVPKGFDLLAAVEQLAGQGVAGYYRPDQKDIAVVESDGLLDALAPWTLAHEYVHALQDQHFDIQATVEAAPQGDAQTAVSALVEGDATLLMTALALNDALSGTPPPTGAEQVGLSADAAGMEDFPPALSRELLFPYLDGMDFVQRIWGRGGWAAVDDAWADPPRSSEQIMHPERYPADVPVAVALPDVARRLGQGWHGGARSTMGELRLSILVAGKDHLDVPLVPLGGIELPNAAAAEGWAGDRIATVDGPDGAWGVVWQTAWDSPEDAAEFAAAARRAMPGWVPVNAVHEGLSISPGIADEQAVLLLTADSDRTLRLLERALIPS
jgi:hypothetical protein